MIMKHSVLICLIISVILMGIATLVYPGGSLHDKNSIGFDWSENFFSNLFEEKAINGSENTSRIWALTGMVFHSFGYGIFLSKDCYKTLCNYLKTYRCDQHIIYILNCNPLARHNGNNIKHVFLNWLILYYCIYP